MLVNNYQVCILQVLTCPGYDVFLAYLLQVFLAADSLFPADAVNKGVNVLHGPAAVLFKGLHVLKLDIVDGRLYKLVVKLAVTKFGNLCNQDILNFLQRLALLGGADQHQLAVVVHSVRIRLYKVELLLLGDVQVKDAGHAVVKQHVCNGQKIALF